MKMLLLFLVLQKFFSHNHKIITKYLVGTVLDNCVLLGHLTKVRRSCPDNIKTEIAFSLLEELLTLYIRTFIFVHVYIFFCYRQSKGFQNQKDQNKMKISQNRYRKSILLTLHSCNFPLPLQMVPFPYQPLVMLSFFACVLIIYTVSINFICA